VPKRWCRPPRYKTRKQGKIITCILIYLHFGTKLAGPQLVKVPQLNSELFQGDQWIIPAKFEKVGQNHNKQAHQRQIIQQIEYDPFRPPIFQVFRGYVNSPGKWGRTKFLIVFSWALIISGRLSVIPVAGIERFTQTDFLNAR